MDCVSVQEGLCYQKDSIWVQLPFLILYLTFS